MKVQKKLIPLYRKFTGNYWPEEAIIVYRVSPYEQRMAPVFEGIKHSPYKSEYKYQHSVVLDLWFIYLKFSWIDRKYHGARQEEG